MTLTRHFANVAGRRVHYRMAGSGPPLVMAHQSPRSSAELEPLMRRWAKHFTCIAPDTPGFGQSAPLPGHPGIDEFADAIVALFDALDLKKVAAYGFHSGGIVLVTALRRHPERFSALAIGGYAVWTEEERRVFGESYLPRFTPSAYGEHLVWLWNRVLEQTWFFPWFDVRHEARLGFAHADPARTDLVIRDMLDSGDAYHAGYGAVLNAKRDIPAAGSGGPPVLITAYDGDPLQAHLARLGDLPASWSARAVATPVAHQEASLEFLRQHLAPPAEPPPQVKDEGFCRVNSQGFEGLVHWRGDRASRRVLLHAPGGSAELLEGEDALKIDLPGHGLSDDCALEAGISAWARLAADAIGAVSTAPNAVIAGEESSALLAIAAARELGAEAVEAVRAHVPHPGAAVEWVERHPDLSPDRFGGYLTAAWAMVRSSCFFWPWFRADAGHVIPFSARDVALERLALRHRSLIRARSGRALLRAVLTADRTQLLAGAPPIRAWQVAEWARRHPRIWLPG